MVNQLALCVPDEDDVKVKICPISIEASANHLLEPRIYRKGMYIKPIDTLNVIVYEMTNDCHNSDDTENIALKLTSPTSGLFDGFFIYFNNDDTVTVDITETAVTVYTIEIDKSKLTVGDVTSITIKHTDGTTYEITGTPLFYYVQNSIASLTANQFELGTDDKSIIFTFTNDISYVKEIKLIDTDPTVSTEEKYLLPKTECTKVEANKEVTCTYDLTEVYGVKYSLSYISQCNDKEIVLTNFDSPNAAIDFIEPVLPVFVVTATGVFEVGKKGTFTIVPDFRKSVTTVTLIKIDDSTEIEIETFTTPSNGELSIAIPSSVVGSSQNYKVKLTMDRREIESSAFTIVTNFVTLEKSEIKLPQGTINALIVPLTNPIDLFQITQVTLDSNVQAATLNTNKKSIEISSPLTFNTNGEYLLEITAEGQELITFTIKVFDPPSIVFPQTLFIIESELSTIEPVITNPDELIIDQIVEATVRSPNPDKYKITLDRTATITKSYEYKIETYGDYYFSIPVSVIIVNEEFTTLFNKVFDCNLITNKEFTIDLTLLSTTGGIVQNSIELHVYNQSEITFTKDATTYQYKQTDIAPGSYSFELLYNPDTIPFYKGSFTLTSFDESRATFNIARSPFKIDFNDVICNLGLPDLEVKEASSSLNVPLTCTYANNTISCTLSSSSDISSLATSTSYNIYNSTSYLIHTIELIQCIGSTGKIDSVLGQCLKSCGSVGTKVYVYNTECVEACPSNTVNLNNYCVEEFSVVSETDTSVKVDADLATMQTFILDNFIDFISFGKTITGTDFSIQLYKPSSPIEDKTCSRLSTDNIEKDIDEPLVVFKVDKVIANKITYDVSFDMYTETGGLIPKMNYKQSQYNITIPINTNEFNLSKAMQFAEIGVDIYNAGDSFFNDICFAYSTENDTDVILKDRRKDIFENVSFCPEGSVYKGIDFETNQAKCEVDPSDDSSLSFNDFTKDIFFK